MWALALALGVVVVVLCVAAFIHWASVTGSRGRTTLEMGPESAGEKPRQHAA
jgi:hypothetical protein